MSSEYRKGIAVVVGPLVMALLFATAGRADDQWLSLGGGMPASGCNPPMRQQLSGGFMACLVPTSMCLAHGGHIGGREVTDPGIALHCVGSDLVAARR